MPPSCYDISGGGSRPQWDSLAFCHSHAHPKPTLTKLGTSINVSVLLKYMDLYKHLKVKRRKSASVTNKAPVQAQKSLCA